MPTSLSNRGNFLGEIITGASFKIVLIFTGICMAACAISSMVNKDQLGNGFLSAFASVFIILGGALMYLDQGKAIKEGLSTLSTSVSD